MEEMSKYEKKLDEMARNYMGILRD